MLHLLKRHPISVVARFRHALVITYAFPTEVLQSLLPPGLEVDRHGDVGFLALAMVQTEAMRPSFLPSLFGGSFGLTGYRVFAKYRTPRGSVMRGLRIIRSDASHRVMVRLGNLLTHYKYGLAEIVFREQPGLLEVRIGSRDGHADAHVLAYLGNGPAVLPEGSPFASIQEARRFAGPLPYTFDYEPETHSIIRIKGVREDWNPRLVRVEVKQLSFFDHSPFHRFRPILASAFHVSDIPYRWLRGIRESLPRVRL